MAQDFLEEHTLEYIRDFILLKSGDRVVVAVSGGPDSIALLHVLATLAGELSIKLCAVYVDHGLRPGETAAERELVAVMADKLGVEFKSGRVAVSDYAAAHGMSIEAAARYLRYEFLEKMAEELGGAVIAVAHTADDQAEEVLLRLLRGAGRKGLAGMVPVNYRGVIRPFLGVPKGRLLDYLDKHALSFLEDSSNTERDFLRNRVRLDLLPYLEEHFNPAVRQTLLRTGEILGAEDDLLDRLAGDLYLQAVTEDETGVLIIDIALLLEDHQALRRRVVERAMVAVEAQPSFHHIDRVLQLAASGENGRELHLSEGLRVLRREGQLDFSYPAGRVGHRQNLAESKAVSFNINIDGPGLWPVAEAGFSIKVEVGDEVPERDELMEMTSDYLDMAGIDFPLTVRSPEAGDRFHPLGAPGSRKVADFLADRKVPRERRCRVPVVLNRERILALSGFRVDHRYRLLDNTKEVLKMTIVRDLPV